MIDVLDHAARWAVRFQELRTRYAEALAAAGVPVVAIVLRAGADGRHEHVLRRDGDLRAQYGAVKKRVASAAADICEYGAGKNAMVQRIILAAAGLSQDELGEPLTGRQRRTDVPLG